ncbi:hypothetical protein D3C75_989520 [compost metagenome]
MKAEFRREVSNVPAFVVGVGFMKPGLAPGIGVPRSGNLLVEVCKCLISGQSGPILGRCFLKHPDRAVINNFPFHRINGAEQLQGLFVPAEP